ncbi:MAG: alkaline phosphatase [Phycisphaerae bacterium]
MIPSGWKCSAWFSVLLLGLAGCQSRQAPVGSVIFLHPDGTSSANWAVGRNLLVGPDGQLQWDRLPVMAVYRGHMADSLTATSNGGATTHAYGVKVYSDAYGTWGGPLASPILDRNGASASVARQAIAAGLPVGLVQSGTSTEPGTGCFVTSVPDRGMHEEIAAQLVASDADVMLGGGEKYYLPAGTKGLYGPGVRKDGRNLIEEARQLGYTVVRTRQELMDVPADTEKLLGIFAEYHTFNDKPEEVLAEQNLPLYWPEAPTVGEMTRVALRVLEAKNKRFLLVIEEEGTDNFGNNNNAVGLLEAMRRADEAIGICRDYVENNPRTLLLTAADSDGGGMRLRGIKTGPGRDVPAKLPPTDRNGAPIDGVGGTGTAPFVAAPDRFGKRLPFAVTWASLSDVTGGVLIRAEGFNSRLVSEPGDNTQIAEIMRTTLFGPAAAGPAQTVPPPRKRPAE